MTPANASACTNEPVVATLAPRAWAALAILTASYAFAFTDRQILNLVVDPMKRDLGISDKQVGFLMGPAFTITYVAVGLFADYCADRRNRRNLLVLAGILWSAATIATALAGNYHTMIVTRLIVGASEAFLFPSGMSLVAEMFDRRRLPIATTIYLTAPYIGGGLALIIGGIVIGYTGQTGLIVLPFAVMHGWQVAVAVVGLLGAVPILLLLTIPEPRRGALALAGDDLRRFGFWEGTAFMLKRWRFYVMLFLGVSFISILLNSVPAWAPTMFIRQFGMSAHNVGLIYGVLVLTIGVLAGLCSPLFNRLLAKRYFDAPMRTVLVGPAMLIVFGVLLQVARDERFAMACVALITFGYVFPLPMAGVSLQLATPPQLRGLSAAYYFVTVSVIGVGIGPILVPFATADLLHDETRLNTAIGIVTVGCEIIALVLLWFAFRGFSAERRSQGASKLPE